MITRRTASVLAACTLALAAVTQSADVQAAPQDGYQLAIVAGNNQTHARVGSVPRGGGASFKPLSVKVTDAAGTPIPNVPILWTSHYSGQMVGQFLPTPGAKSITTSTNAQGLAVLDKMQGHAFNVYYADGAFTMTAAINGMKYVTFALTVGQPSYLAKIVSGDGQVQHIIPTTRPNGRVFPLATFAPLDALVTDSDGTPAPGLTVTWTCNGAPQACSLAPGGDTTVATTTDARGHAMLKQLFGNAGRYKEAGAFTITTSGAKITPLTFHLRAIVTPVKV